MLALSHDGGVETAGHRVEFFKKFNLLENETIFKTFQRFSCQKSFFLRNISKIIKFYKVFWGFRKIILQRSILQFLWRKIQLILLFSWEIYQKYYNRSRRSIGNGLKTHQNFEESRMEFVEKFKIIKIWIRVFNGQRMYSKLHARFWSSTMD